MSNLSEGLIEQGRAEGRLLERIANVLSVIKHGVSIEDAFRLLDVDDQTKQAVLEKLKEEHNV